MDGRLRMIDDRAIKLADSIKELQDLLKKHCKSTFTIKGSPFEVCLKILDALTNAEVTSLRADKHIHLWVYTLLCHLINVPFSVAEYCTVNVY